MVKLFDLDRKVILISGGYGYLGKAITESLAYHGGTVYVLGRNKDKFDNAFGELDKTLISRIFFLSCDVSSTEQISAVFEEVYRKEGRIDVLINNAFYSRGQSPESMSDEDWSYGIDGTLSSVFRSIREIIPHFKRSGCGKIINVSSMYGVVAPDFEIYEKYPRSLNPPHYGAAKAGIIQLTKYYANYLGKLNVQVNAVTPGPFPSEETQEEQGFIEALSKKTSLRRIGQPEDLAGAFVFLSSETSDYITGQNLIIDGGWTCQ